jgi:MATE family multidrug resistance protein
VVATASTIMFNWDLVSFVPLSIEIAVTSLVGRIWVQVIGYSTPQLCRYKTGIFYSMVILFLFLLIPGWPVMMFIDADKCLLSAD